MLENLNVEIENFMAIIAVSTNQWTGTESIIFTAIDPEGESDFIDLLFIITRMPGDITGDGEVNSFDIQALTDEILFPENQLTESQFNSVDLNSDGTLTGEDVVLMVNIVNFESIRDHKSQ